MSSAFEDLANAVNNLVEIWKTDRQVEEGQQIILAQTPEQLAEEINKIKSKFEQLQIVVKEHVVKEHVVKEHDYGRTEAVSGKLDAAFQILYHLATWIHGDPDDLHTEQDEEDLKVLQASVMAKLEEAKAESDRAHEALCAARAMVSLGRKNMFVVYIRTLTILSHIGELKHVSLQRVKSLARSQISVFKTAYGGVGGQIDIATLQTAKDDIENARLALEGSRWHHIASTLAANIDQYALLRAIIDLIPGVGVWFTHKTIETSFLVFSVEANKSVAEQCWDRIMQLRDTATPVTRLATLQEEYADALLDLCILGHVYGRRAGIIGRIVREVASYPTVVGNEELEIKLEHARRYLPRGVDH
ncbi:hypothetical protein Q7P36_002684 [Cladosporium allicinum]